MGTMNESQNTQGPVKAVLACSLILNILLACGMVWIGFSARRRVMELMSEEAAEQIQIQEEILEMLEEKGPEGLDSVKATIRLNVDVSRRLQYKLDTDDIDM
jgi:hypothetical protein